MQRLYNMFSKDKIIVPCLSTLLFLQMLPEPRVVFYFLLGLLKLHFNSALLEIRLIEQNYDINRCTAWLKEVMVVQNKVGTK